MANINLNMILNPDSLLGIPLFGLKEVGAAIAKFIEENYNNIMDTINPKEMIKYIKGELTGKK